MDPHRGKPRDAALQAELSVQLAPGLMAEDHGTEFYIISEGEGHDLTLSLEAPVAERLARFILSRRGLAASGGKQ